MHELVKVFTRAFEGVISNVPNKNFATLKNKAILGLKFKIFNDFTILRYGKAERMWTDDDIKVTIVTL